jgi:hypothetical protein
MRGEERVSTTTDGSRLVGAEPGSVAVKLPFPGAVPEIRPIQDCSAR